MKLRHKKLIKYTALILGIGMLTATLSACEEDAEDWSLSMRSRLGDLPLKISTYDANGQKIDQVKAKSVDIHTDNEMSKEDDNGHELSSVIDVDYGNHRMTHVGSTLIAYEGLKNYEDEFTRHVNIDDHQKAVPLLNTMYQDFKNSWHADAKVVMIRSQLGLPIAVFTGNRVSIHNSDMKNSTKFVIDGHRLFVYRADYTIYPMASIQNPNQANGSNTDNND